MRGNSFDEDNSNKKHTDFKTIFDGTNLNGWKMCGPGRFDLIDNMIISHDGMGLLW